MENIFATTVEQVLPKVLKWRHYLHEHPELSYEEFQTTDYLIKQIEALPGVTYTRPTPTGVVARLVCDNPGPTIALRGDIDALPVTELCDLPFASQEAGKMHACGHDSHAAMLMGALYTLYAHRHDLRGTFVFLFQPAEEKFPGGARAFIEKGVLDGVDAIIGQHTDPTLPTGVIATKPGAISANSDVFTITITGRGGHASQPQNCLDPLPVGAQIVTALQQVVSRRVGPTDSAVLSVTTFHCGTADNIIADTATIQGTVRTLTDDTHNMIEQAIKDIVRQYTEAFGLTGDVNYVRGYAATLNTPAYAHAVLNVTRDLYGEDDARLSKLGLGGEDFGFYLRKVPGCFYHFGITPQDAKEWYPNHNARFYIDEASFPVALNVMVNSAVKFQDIVEENATAL